MAGTAAGTCATSPWDAGGARDVASGLARGGFCPVLAGRLLPQPGGGGKPRAAAVGAHLPLLSSPRFSPRWAAAPRRAEPALRVCACVGGGLPHGFSEGWEGTHGLGCFFLGPRWLSVLPAAVMDSIIIQERLVERLLSPRTQAQRSHPAKLKVRGCIYSTLRAGEQQGQEGGGWCPSRRTPHKMSPLRSRGAERRW